MDDDDRPDEGDDAGEPIGDQWNDAATIDDTGGWQLRTDVLLPLALAPLACDPPAKPPSVSLAACRVDEDTARVSARIVPRGQRVTLQIPGNPGEAGVSTTERLAYDAVIDGRQGRADRLDRCSHPVGHPVLRIGLIVASRW